MKNKIENIRPCHTQKDKHMQEKDRLKCNFKNAKKKFLKEVYLNQRLQIFGSSLILDLSPNCN